MLIKRTEFLFQYLIFIFMFLFVSAASYAQDTSPQRIISLAPAITEELYLLGVEERIVGVTTYCQEPPDAQNKEKIGMVKRVNVEKIVSLKPDLILDLSMTNPEQIEKLKNLGLRVVSFPYPKDFSEICGQFLELGQMVGKVKQAKKIIDTAKKEVDSIKEKVKDLQKPRVFVQIGARPLFTVIKDSFIHDFIELAGGINIAFETKTGFYSREEVLRKNPDVIIIVTMGIAGEREKDLWQNYRALNATKNNRIYIIDSDKICSPTPGSFVEVLEEIVKFLHEGVV